MQVVIGSACIRLCLGRDRIGLRCSWCRGAAINGSRDLSYIQGCFGIDGTRAIVETSDQGACGRCAKIASNDGINSLIRDSSPTAKCTESRSGSK